MNLLPEFGVRMNLVRHGRWFGETNEFHKQAFHLEVDCSKSAQIEESSSRGALKGGLTSVDSGLQLNLEIAQAVSQRRLSPQPVFQAGQKCVEASGDVIEDNFTTGADSRK
jgi:hypothetical protein